MAGILSEAVAAEESPAQGAQRQLPPQVDNPGGFFESQQLVAFNETLLDLVGVDWQRPPLHPIHWQDPQLFPELFKARKAFASRATRAGWVDKDPRLCITYPAYLHILLRRVPVAAVIRHPFEVAGSLYARDIVPFSRGLLIWFLYNQHLSRFLRDDQDVLVSYASLIEAQNGVVEQLATFLDANQAAGDCSNHLDQLLVRIANPSWRRQSETYPDSQLPQQEWHAIAQDCLDRYQAIAGSGFAIEAYRSAFASTPDAVLGAYSVQSWQCPARHHHVHEQELYLLRDQYSQLIESTSWRVTAPLRWCVDGVKAVRQGAGRLLR